MKNSGQTYWWFKPMDSISSFAWINKFSSKGNLRWPWIWFKDVKFHTLVAKHTLTGSVKREKSFHCRTFLISGDAVKGQEGSCLTSRLSLHGMAYKYFNSCVSDWVRDPNKCEQEAKVFKPIVKMLNYNMVMCHSRAMRVLQRIIGFTKNTCLKNAEHFLWEMKESIQLWRQVQPI